MHPIIRVAYRTYFNNIPIIDLTEFIFECGPNPMKDHDLYPQGTRLAKLIRAVVYDNFEAVDEILAELAMDGFDFTCITVMQSDNIKYRPPIQYMSNTLVGWIVDIGSVEVVEILVKYIQDEEADIYLTTHIMDRIRWSRLTGKSGERLVAILGNFIIDRPQFFTWNAICLYVKEICEFLSVSVGKMFFELCLQSCIEYSHDDHIHEGHIAAICENFGVDIAIRTLDRLNLENYYGNMQPLCTVLVMCSADIPDQIIDHIAPVAQNYMHVFADNFLNVVKYGDLRSLMRIMDLGFEPVLDVKLRRAIVLRSCSNEAAMLKRYFRLMDLAAMSIITLDQKRELVRQLEMHEDTMELSQTLATIMFNPNTVFARIPDECFEIIIHTALKDAAYIYKKVDGPMVEVEVPRTWFL